MKTNVFLAQKIISKISANLVQKKWKNSMNQKTSVSFLYNNWIRNQKITINYWISQMSVNQIRHWIKNGLKLKRTVGVFEELLN
jgi:hypothetical protein